MSPLRSLASASLLLTALVASGQGRSYLNVGDPAPALSPAKWLKGTPVPAFEKGRVYVVEFWATWCGPCKANIPHLTELAQRYAGKASIVGVDVWESSDPTIVTLPKVEGFVKGQGARMNYHVAADAGDNRVANAWMKRAGEGGLPTSFVVGKDGRIAWIGNPIGLEAVLAQVVNDRFDVAAARERRATDVEVTRPIAEALEGRNWKALLALTDKAIARNPESAARYEYDRLLALFHVDPAAGKSRAEEILKASNGEVGAFQMIASIFASQKDLRSDSYRYGQEVVARALAKKDREYLFLAMGAEIAASRGDVPGAVRSQTEAVKMAELDSHCPKEFLIFLRKNLDRFVALNHR